MSFVDHQGEVEYPYSFKTVFDAIIEAAPKMDGLSLDSADEVSGRVTFKSGVSLRSWGENIPIQLVRLSSARTKMQIVSSPKTGAMFGGAFDLGKNRENIDKIIKAVSDVLSKKPEEVEEVQQQPATSTADELLKLKALKDEGVISQTEFNEQKEKVLAQTQSPISVKSPTPTTSLQSDSQPVEKKEPIRIESKGKDKTWVIAIVIFTIIMIIFAIVEAASF